MPYQKVTLLEDLPDLNDMNSDSQYDMQASILEDPRMPSNIATRHLRKGHVPHSQSGMDQPDNYMTERVNRNINIENASIIEQQPRQLSCQDVYYHIEDCPMCKKFHRNDNTVYLIIIAALIILCTLLFKKVLNV